MTLVFCVTFLTYLALRMGIAYFAALSELEEYHRVRDPRTGRFVKK